MVPCAHFHKQVYSTFGIPFYVKVKNSEPFYSVRDRMQKKLDIPDKEWEKVNIEDKFKFSLFEMETLKTSLFYKKYLYGLITSTYIFSGFSFMLCNLSHQTSIFFIIMCVLV